MKPLRVDVLSVASHHCFTETSSCKLFGEGPPEKRCFGGCDVGEVTEDGGEAPRAEELGEGDANEDADAACQRPEKSRENAPELISCIFYGLRLGVIVSSNINLLASLLALRKIQAFPLVAKNG